LVAGEMVVMVSRDMIRYDGGVVLGGNNSWVGEDGMRMRGKLIVLSLLSYH